MIISLVAILVLLCKETKEEDEIKWFFPTSELDSHSEDSQFLGWRMGSSGMTECKLNEKTKIASAGPKLGSGTTANIVNKAKSKLQTSFSAHLQNKLSNLVTRRRMPVTGEAWKTIVIADSTLHYIPLEEMATVKAALYPFIPAEDALDPFYFDPVQLSSSRKQLFNDSQKSNQLVAQKLNLQRLQPLKNPVQLPVNSFIPNPPPRYSQPEYKFPSVALVGNKPKPLQLALHNTKLKTGPRMWSEPRRTMFIHPWLLDMMKAMDRSILSYPSRFDYKSMELFPANSKGMPIKRHYNKIF